jgi:hypothetical protein
MFVRVKLARVKGHEYQYLQIVEAYRQGPKVRQQVVANLGRLDRLLDSGQLEKIVDGLARFSQAYQSYRAFVEGRFDRCVARLWGVPLVFGRLWERQGLPEVLGRLAEGRKFQFDVERAVFAMALHRLCDPGSDLQCSQWVPTVEAPGFSSLRLQHFYRTCGFLSEVRGALEKALFFKDRDLFSQELDLVFLDTTSTYVYRDAESALCRRGYSRDRHPELPQFVLCVAVDRHGWPIAWEIYPGNTADQKAFAHIIAVFRERLRIRRVMVVADRGMISKDTLGLLTDHAEAPFDYIMGCRMRREKEVSEVVLSRGGRYRKVADNLEVKEVTVGDHRYVVCHNPEEAKKDASARESILAKLEEVLSHGPKSVIGNKGFKRFLKVRKGAVSIDAEAIKREARLDGKFVLRTNTDLSAEEVARSYKSLWRVERVFREQKSTLEIRPIYHHRDDTSVGHIVASFLALRLELDLQRKLEEKGIDVSWPDVMRDLSGVQAVHIDLDGRRFVIRTDLGGWAAKAFAAVGLRAPSRISENMTECSA